MKTAPTAPAPVAPPSVPVATLPVEVLADGSTFVPVATVANALGAMDEFVLNRAKAYKVEVVSVDTGSRSGPDTRTGFRLEDAVGLLVRLRKEQDDHSDHWQAYVAYREAKKREAAEKRDQAIREQREAEAKRSRLFATEAAKEAQRRANEEAAQRLAEKAAREGEPAPFESWKPS